MCEYNLYAQCVLLGMPRSRSIALEGRLMDCCMDCCHGLPLHTYTVVCCLPSRVLSSQSCAVFSVVCCLHSRVLSSQSCAVFSVVCCLLSRVLSSQSCAVFPPRQSPSSSVPPCPSVLERGQGRGVSQHDRPPPTLQTSCQPCNIHPPAWSLPAVC